MATRYILFDCDPRKTKVWQKKFDKNLLFDIVCASVDDVVADIYVSPANAYGQLDGGIDKVYRTMFSGIQGVVNDILKSYPNKKINVGSGLRVKVPNRNKELLLTPTMEIPCKLKTPWNAFWSSLAIFYITKDFKGTIAIPGLGTGTGHLEADEMIDMMKLAWRVCQNLPVQDVYTNYTYIPQDRLVLEESLHERPIPRHLTQLN